MNIFEKFRYACDMKKVRKHIREHNYSNAISILKLQMTEENLNKWRYCFLLIEVNYFLGNKDTAHQFFVKLIKMFLEKLDRGDANRQEVAWIIGYYFHKFHFNYETITNYITVADYENNEDVRFTLRHTFSIDEFGTDS